MSLVAWAESGWLLAHETSAHEVRGLLRAAAAEITDAEKDISAGSRFSIAYGAALRLCSIVLFAAGFHAARDQKHYRTIAALPLVLGPGAREQSQFLDRCRVKRHEVTYEFVDSVSNAEVDELIEAVRELETQVHDWLARHHPHLLA